MLALRVTKHEVAPRDELRALAREFPGALRELDQRSLGAIKRRIGVLRLAARGARRPPWWAEVWVMYHARVRKLLEEKRRDGAGNKEKTRNAALGTTAPLRGRLTTVVAGQIAAELGLGAARVARELLGRAPSKLR